MPRPIPIGHSDGRNVRLSVKRRSTHLHVMGASGQGKSKFLEHCIREDILAGHGVCLIDPEGDLYENIVAWCARERMEQRRKIHLFDPTEPNWRFRFNPLHVHENEKPRHRVDNVIEALAQVWGGEDSRNTPAIRTTLRAVFSALVAKGYTLAEAFYLTNTVDPYRIVAYITHGLENPIMKDIWGGYIAQMQDPRTQREHAMEFGGSRRRFAELLTDDEIREVFASYEDPIDFRKVMDDDEIVLINLAPEAMGEDPARAFGALFLREMYYASQRRNTTYGQAHPFYAYIDECAEFVTRDISRILARSRKRGFHLILAHQWLQQLREQGEDIYHGVMGIQNKVIFGGISDQDAVEMADQLFRTEYDLEIPIQALIKPGVVGYRRTWLHNWSKGSSVTDIDMQMESTSTIETSVVGTSYGEGVAQSFDADGFPSAGYTVTSSMGSSSVDISGVTKSEGRAWGTATSESKSEGASEAMEPILQDLATAVHGLENVRHMAVARLRNIPPRNAVVKGSTEPSFDITTHDVEEVLVPEENVKAFKERVFSSSPYTIKAHLAEEQMRIEYQKLFAAAKDHVGGFEPAPYAKTNEHDDGELG